MNEWQEYIKACDAWEDHIYNERCEQCWFFKQHECSQATKLKAEIVTKLDAWLKS